LATSPDAEKNKDICVTFNTVLSGFPKYSILPPVLLLRFGSKSLQPALSHKSLLSHFNQFTSSSYWDEENTKVLTDGSKMDKFNHLP
jgi:hypothetical protein